MPVLRESGPEKEMRKGRFSEEKIIGWADTEGVRSGAGMIAGPQEASVITPNAAIRYCVAAEPMARTLGGVIVAASDGRWRLSLLAGQASFSSSVRSQTSCHQHAVPRPG